MATTRRSSARAKSAPGINRDYSEVEYRESSIYDGPEPTKGIYRMKLVNVDDYTKQGEDKPSSVQWVFEILEGEENKHGDSVTGWRGRKYTTENSAWSEQKIAVALGLIKPNGKLTMSFADILKKAKPCRALIAMERYVPEDGDPEWRAALTSEFLVDDGETKRSTRPTDDDDDQDGDDEPPKTASRRGRGKAAEPEPEPEPEADGDDDGGDLPTEEELEEYAAELEELSAADLKARATEHEVIVKRGMKAEAIIEAILDDAATNGFLDEPEDEPEPEPEPEPAPAPRARRGSAAKAAPARRGRRGSTDDPPF